MADSDLVERIERLLPQTQCGKCGYAGCRPYARAIAGGETEINRCPPGGEAGMKALAGLLDVAEMPLDESCGVHYDPPRVAVIDEASCIGCTRCIQACPVDAIAGAAKRMHTVIEDECTGCELCLAPCPVDCIDMVAATARAEETRDRQMARAQWARRRYEARNKRVQKQQKDRAGGRREYLTGTDRSSEQGVIAAALTRARPDHPRGETSAARTKPAVSKAIERARAERRAARESQREQN